MRAKFAMIAGIVFSVSRRERARKFVTVLAFPTSQIVLRIAALVVIAASLISLLARTGLSIDATAERLHTLQPQTRALIEAIPADRPVVIRAYFSPEVPEGYVTTRKNLLNVLHRFDDLAGDRLDVIVHDTEPFTRVATEAVDNYGIMPRPLVEVAASQRTTSDVFLGLVFTSGPEEFVIPFFDRGLPVEYELARSVRVVSQSDRNKLGIVATDVKLFGGFDFQTMSSSPDWSIVRELRKQYDVQQISPDGPYPDDLDAIVAVLPSSMSQSQLDALQDAILSGTPALLFDDPLPMFNPNLSPSLPRDAARNPFTSQGQPPAEPKGDFSALLASLGLSWRPTGIVWSAYNPHPGIADVNPEVVFVSRARDNEIPFNPESVISSGLQEVVAIFAGAVRADRPIAGSTLTATPLLQTGTVSGETDWNSIVQRGFLGVQLNPNPRRFQSPGAYTLAMRVTGAYPPAAAPPPGAEGEPPPPPPDLDVVFVSDVDIISETFFDLRRQGFEDFNFDNVTFALNCIDVLAGDESFVTLRKHRPRHRTLTLVERQKEEFALAQRAQIDTAEAEAESELQLAQQNLDQKVEELRQRTDLDEQTKAIMLRNLEEVENRRFRVTEASIQQDKQQQIDRAEAQMQTNIDRIQRSIKWLAAALPPIPTLILAIAFFAYRFNRERITVSERRLVEGT
jgi:ABC-2 type transport system permease protein